MKRKNSPFILFQFLLIFLTFFSSAYGQNFSPHQKIGISTQATLPIGNLGDWYGVTPNFGANIRFVTSAKLQIEIEYGYARYLHGSIEDKAFLWPVDKEYYKSPKAKAEMPLHWFLVNFYFFREEKIISGKSIFPFFTVGSGFYAFNNQVSGLIYPGQGRTPLDKSLLLPAVSDNQVALGANFGIGFEIPMSKRLTVDVGLRYHIIFGTIRPFEDWGMGEIFPLQMFDFGSGIFYNF